MKKILFFILVASVLPGCAGSESSVPEKIAALNSEATKITVEKSNRQVTVLFDKTIHIAFYNAVCDYADGLRNDAFDRDDFSGLDAFAEKAKPVYRAITGGDANYISPDVVFFREKCFPGTVEYRFFGLAAGGWIGLNGEMHGGKNNFPEWIEQIDGITGNFMHGPGRAALEKWKAILPELEGNYRIIASNTVSYLESGISGTKK